MRKRKPPEIKTLSQITQVVRTCSGFYDFNEGTIELGCDEKHTPVIIWHEFMHMLFFEEFFLEACLMWDNIADELQEYLFDIKPAKMPYAWTQKKTVEISKSWIGVSGAGIRKSSNKNNVNIRKQETQKRKPLRPVSEHYKIFIEIYKT